MALFSYCRSQISLIFILIVPMLFANKSLAFDLPQDREAISRQIVDVGSLGDYTVESDNAVIWDFAHIAVSSDCKLSKWRNFGDSVLVRIENGSQWIYNVRHDSVFLEKHENKLMSLSDSISPLVGYRTLSSSDGISSPFYFKGNFPNFAIGQYNFISETIDINVSNLTWHGIGHVIYAGKSQDKVLDFDNKTRVIMNMPERPYDETHNYKII